MPRLYHIADKPTFKPDPKHQPTLNRTLVETLKPGIFLTELPELWASNYGYRRPYLIEFDVPADVLAKSIHGSNEVYIPAEFYDRLRIVRAITQDCHGWEKWRAYGGVDEMTGKNHITGEPLVEKSRSWGNVFYEPPAGGWVAPDARTLPTPVLRQYEKDYRAWRRKQPKGFMASLRTGQSTPGVYYHVTAYRNWGSIRDTGLRPDSRGHVWLFTNSEQAMLFKDSYGTRTEWSGVDPSEWTMPPCMIVVRTDRAVPTEAGIPGAYWVEGPVTPDEIYDVVRPGDLRHYTGRRTASEDYRGHHQAPTSADDVAAPFHDVEEMMPDYYEHPEYYSHDGRNSAVSRETEAAIKAARGKPNAMVTIYRALPPGYTSINPGDWVTPSLAYARQHAISNGEDDWPVITAKVPAKTLWTEGYAAEWGYSGPSISARTARLLTASLPTSGVYYRTHDHSRPFSVEDATSRSLSTSFDDYADQTRKGYSCLENPWDLWVYLIAFGWMKPHYIDNDDVVCFSGTKKRNKGTDGEPLVVPDMRTVKRYSWPEFERLLLATPRPAVPGGPGARHGFFDNWAAVANRSWDAAKFSKVAQMLVDESLVAIGMEPQFSKTASDTYDEHVMVALRPSEATRKVFADMDECTEAVEDLHLTLFYFGTKDDVGGEPGKERLYRGLYDFAIHSGYRGLTGTVGGYGVFRNEQDALITLWDIPGIAEFRTHLMAKVKDHGIEVRQENHGFTPHMTLAYSDETVTTLPEVPDGIDDEEIFGSIWLVWGEEWTEVTLP